MGSWLGRSGARSESDARLPARRAAGGFARPMRSYADPPARASRPNPPCARSAHPLAPSTHARARTPRSRSRRAPGLGRRAPREEARRTRLAHPAHGRVRGRQGARHGIHRRVPRLGRQEGEGALERDHPWRAPRSPGRGEEARRLSPRARVGQLLRARQRRHRDGRRRKDDDAALEQHRDRSEGPLGLDRNGRRCDDAPRAGECERVERSQHGERRRDLHRPRRQGQRARGRR